MSPAMRAVLEALASATAAGVASAIAGNDADTAIEAARGALMSAQTTRADAEGETKFPEFRSQ